MLIRFSYSVTGPVKFLSHLDLLKYFCKAVKRAGIPIAYSEGFNPHPKIAFGPPRGVAIAGLNEYCDMKLKTEMAAGEFTEKFNAALPKGIRINSARIVRDKVKPLQAVINRADYEAEIFDFDGDGMPEKIAELMQAENVEFVRRNPKKGNKTINLRSGIDTLSWRDTAEGGKLSMSLIFGAQGSVKPTEVVKYLTEGAGKCVIVRTGLFVMNEKGSRELP
ncbi:MAG: TIGR03936 family radical SAM-associated protein [Bacillota bacterium]|jgi:radical SAM-linked protein